MMPLEADPGKLEQLRRWWDKLNECWPAFGYFPDTVKTWLIVKESQLALAKELFRDTSVKITTEGHRLLGASVGTRQFCERFMEDAVASWKQQLETLASVARVQPHTAYAAFIHGFVGELTCLARTAENTGALFQPLEDTIRGKLIPLLTGRSAPGDMVRELLALPPRSGGIGLINPAIALQNELERSVQTCAPLADQIRNQESRLGDVCQLVLAIVPQLQPVGNKSLLMLLRPCKLPCRLHSNGTWTFFQTKVPRTGSPFSQ